MLGSNARLAASEVVDFLVSVQVGSLEQHLLSHLGIPVLVLHLDASCQLLGVDLLLAHLAVLYCFPLHLFLLLEVALGLQISVGAHALEPVGLVDEAWRVRAGLVVQESVWMGWLCAKSCRWHQFYGKQGQRISNC